MFVVFTFSTSAMSIVDNLHLHLIGYLTCQRLTRRTSLDILERQTASSLSKLSLQHTSNILYTIYHQSTQLQLLTRCKGAYWHCTTRTHAILRCMSKVTAIRTDAEPSPNADRLHSMPAFIQPLGQDTIMLFFVDLLVIRQPCSVQLPKESPIMGGDSRLFEVGAGRQLPALGRQPAQ